MFHGYMTKYEIDMFLSCACCPCCPAAAQVPVGMPVPDDSLLHWSRFSTEMCVIYLHTSLQVGLVISTSTPNIYASPCRCSCHANSHTNSHAVTSCNLVSPLTNAHNTTSFCYNMFAAVPCKPTQLNPIISIQLSYLLIMAFVLVSFCAHTIEQVMCF